MNDKMLKGIVEKAVLLNDAAKQRDRIAQDLRWIQDNIKSERAYQHNGKYENKAMAAVRDSEVKLVQANGHIAQIEMDLRKLILGYKPTI